MVSSNSGDESTARNAAQFATTHWSVVLAAGDSASPDSQEALEKLCRVYWFPLYAFIRRQGKSAEDAKDLTQGFFAYLFEKGLVDKADRERGRFRSFLLTSLKNFLSQEWRRAHAQKRGGHQPVVSLDEQDAESWLAGETGTDLSPDILYERQWATLVVQEAIHLLKQEYEAEGQGALFEQIHLLLQGDREQTTYSEIGDCLGMGESAVKSAAFRMRRRYRELLRAVVANTVNDPLEVDEELRHLINVLAG